MRDRTSGSLRVAVSREGLVEGQSGDCVRLNSRNVTRVNDIQIEGPKELSNGDVMQIGPFRCDVFYDIGSAFRAAADFSNETLMGNAIG